VADAAVADPVDAIDAISSEDKKGFSQASVNAFRIPHPWGRRVAVEHYRPMPILTLPAVVGDLIGRHEISARNRSRQRQKECGSHEPTLCQAGLRNVTAETTAWILLLSNNPTRLARPTGGNMPRGAD
jgi:hypothetical protein